MRTLLQETPFRQQQKQNGVDGASGRLTLVNLVVHTHLHTHARARAHTRTHRPEQTLHRRTSCTCIISRMNK